MKRVLLLTHSFPYGEGETYLEAELKNLPKDARCYLLPIHSDNLKKRDLPREIGVLQLSQTSKASKLRALASAAYCVGLKELAQCRHLTPSTAKELLKFCYSAQVLFRRIKQTLQENQIALDEDTILYSYWMDSAALAVSLLKKNGAIAVCRTHGADLYDERTPWGHQFLRSYLADRLDYVFPISVMGKAYLEKRTGKQESIIPMHLGVEDHGPAAFEKKNCVNIVSCSAVIALKRLDLIVDALALLPDICFTWTHIGDGPEMETIQKLAQEKLPQSSFRFLGRQCNAEVHRYYQKNNVTVFVNTSDTEGIPVAVMEAMSYGIPTVATKVGATAELIREGINGFLITQGSTVELANEIRKIAQMAAEEYAGLRLTTRNAFLSDWEAKLNFGKFYKIIMK